MDTRFDFHSLIRLSVGDLAPDGLRAINKTFGHFLTAETFDRPDIRVEYADPGQYPAHFFSIGKNPAEINVSVHDQTAFVIFRSRERPEMVMAIDECIRIDCLTPDVRPSRLIETLHHAIRIALWNKGGLLFKGACLCRGPDCYVISGDSGAGKTSLLLHLMKHGWDYLADDLFILLDGRAYQFRRHIGFNFHHLIRDPMLFPPQILNRYRWRGPKVREAIRSVAMHRLPSRVASSEKLKRIIDPHLHVDPTELASNCVIVKSTEPRQWMLILPGETTETVPIERSEFIRRMASVHILNYPSFETIRHRLSILGRPLSGEWHDLLDRNILAPTAIVSLSRTSSSGDWIQDFLRSLNKQMEPCPLAEVTSDASSATSPSVTASGSPHRLSDQLHDPTDQHLGKNTQTHSHRGRCDQIEEQTRGLNQEIEPGVAGRLQTAQLPQHRD
jgi:hypothetical protein